MRVFVTVGTTEFDDLVREMDKYAYRTDAEVVCQIGPQARYVPANCRYFRTKLDILDEIRAADVVVSHGGAATILEALGLGKKVIAVSNPKMKKGHQDDLVDHLAAEKLIVKGGLGKLEKALTSKKKLKPYERPECSIHEKLRI